MPVVRKQPWAGSRSKGIVKGKPLNPSAAIEQRYNTALRILIERMIAETQYELTKLFDTQSADEYFAQDDKYTIRVYFDGNRSCDTAPRRSPSSKALATYTSVETARRSTNQGLGGLQERQDTKDTASALAVRQTHLEKAAEPKTHAAQDASISSQARILTNALLNKYTDLFNSLAKPTAERFADESNKSSDIAVKSSIRHMAEAVTLPTKTITSGPLNDVLNAIVTENVGLIKSIPAQYLSGVQGAVMRSITTGNGMQDLVPYLQRHKGITLRRARLISRDQTIKAFSSLSRARMQKLGLTQFIWRHTAGSRHPRHLHIELNGQLCDYNDPPVIQNDPEVRGYPGQLINCLCRAVPVLNFGDTT